MRNISSGCERKSAGSRVHLETPERRSNPEDFWKFYKENQESVDHIIGVQCLKVFNGFQSIPKSISFEDVKQSVLVKCYEDEILRIWDYKRSSLATFLTGRAYFNAQKALNTAISKEPYDRKGEKGMRRRLSQKLYSAMNEIQDDDLEEDIVDDSNLDLEVVDQNNLLEVLRYNLDSRERKVLDLVLRDRTSDEIETAVQQETPEVTKEYIKSVLCVIQRKARALDNGLNISLRVSHPIVQTIRLDRTNIMPVAGKNGKKLSKNRPLTIDEKSALRRLFDEIDGVTQWDTLTNFRLNHMSPAVGDDQPSGYFSHLHKLARRGKIQIRNRAAYNANRISRGQTPLPDLV